MVDTSEKNPGARFLLVAASAVVVAWGLQFAAPILLPFALALFLAVLTLPIVHQLRLRRVPDVLAILVSMAVVVGILFLLGSVVARSGSELGQVYPSYLTALEDLQEGWILDLEENFEGIEWREYLSFNAFDPASIVDVVTSTVGRAATIVSQAFLVFLIMFFILAESTVFPSKLEAVFGGSNRGQEGMRKIIGEIQTYLGIKTAISLLTGILVGAWTAILGLDFPILLGVIAFLLNYIPTVGSIIAAVPAVLLSLILFDGLGYAFVVALGYFAVNTIFGNFIEPNLMGRRLGLSTLVVILSLLFWGWTWGPVGAFLSVPLTMVVKIWLENTRDLRWIAIMLDKQPPSVPIDSGPRVAAAPGASPASSRAAGD